MNIDEIDSEGIIDEMGGEAVIEETTDGHGENNG